VRGKFPGFPPYKYHPAGHLFQYVIIHSGQLSLHPRPFLPARPRLYTILCKFSHDFFFIRVSPTWRVSSGAVRPLVTPLGVGKLGPASVWKAKAGMVHSVSGCMRGVQVKLWDPSRTRAIPERLRGVFTTRRYTNPRLLWLTLHSIIPFSLFRP